MGREKPLRLQGSALESRPRWLSGTKQYRPWRREEGVQGPHSQHSQGTLAQTEDRARTLRARTPSRRSCRLLAGGPAQEEGGEGYG